MPRSPDQPPRPCNPFIIYRASKVREFKSAGLKMSQAENSKAIGHMWRNESPAVKFYFAQLAEEKFREHRRQFPDYKFKPGPPKKFKAPCSSERKTRIADAESKVVETPDNIVLLPSQIPYQSQTHSRPQEPTMSYAFSEPLTPRHPLVHAPHTTSTPPLSESSGTSLDCWTPAQYLETRLLATTEEFLSEFTASGQPLPNFIEGDAWLQHLVQRASEPTHNGQTVGFLADAIPDLQSQEHLRLQAFPSDWAPLQSNQALSYSDEIGYPSQNCISATSDWAFSPTPEIIHQGVASPSSLDGASSSASSGVVAEWNDLHRDLEVFNQSQSQLQPCSFQGYSTLYDALGQVTSGSAWL